MTVSFVGVDDVGSVMDRPGSFEELVGRCEPAGWRHCSGSYLTPDPPLGDEPITLDDVVFVLGVKAGWIVSIAEVYFP